VIDLEDAANVEAIAELLSCNDNATEYSARRRLAYRDTPASFRCSIPSSDLFDLAQKQYPKQGSVRLRSVQS